VKSAENPERYNEGVDSAYAHLTIGSYHLTPDEMVKLVHAEPRRQWRIGDKTSFGPKLHKKHGIQYRSRLDESLGGDEHLYDLIDFIRAHESDLARLTHHEAVESALLGLWSFSTHGVQNFSLSPADLGLLADLDIGLWMVCSWNTEAPAAWRSGTGSAEM
jgi:hypothetical protein